jgi:hypothetical protein
MMEVDMDGEALRVEVIAADEAREVAGDTTTSEEVPTLPKRKRIIWSTRSRYVEL